MNQVLDEIEKTSSPPKTFSKLSFSFSIITICVMMYALSLIPTELAVKDFFAPISTELMYATYAIILSSLIGFIMAIISFVKNEPTTIIKWIGGILNTGIFIFYIGRVFFHIW